MNGEDNIFQSEVHEPQWNQLSVCEKKMSNGKMENRIKNTKRTIRHITGLPPKTKKAKQTRPHRRTEQSLEHNKESHIESRTRHAPGGLLGDNDDVRYRSIN
ncbi:hypothetical protein CDAR_472881 [Caerostris darwini]|uniref:Uncharacterized protein n=1 Tax=Caerostris darwini TaxID=1538125 RepID=A0AAV4V8R6_9ARAC|nr:hypothetical protein CDAR_472881 [Caerostris darwini]